jgi:hypothetical protein
MLVDCHQPFLVGLVLPSSTRHSLRGPGWLGVDQQAVQIFDPVCWLLWINDAGRGVQWEAKSIRRCVSRVDRP